MAKILVLLTATKTLGLLDGREHPSGFWAEELVVPYERFVQEGYGVDIATSGGTVPYPDQTSLSIAVVGFTRPDDSPLQCAKDVDHFKEVIDSIDQLRHPLNVADLTKEDVGRYAGVFISGGHGAMSDMPTDPTMTRVLRWALELDMPLAAVCHGHSALLPLRDSESQWPLRGYKMTAFSREEELVTEIAGQLPFVLQIELQRLGADYEKAETVWDSHVVTDRNLITGQNPFSSAALAETFVNHLGATR